MKTRGKPCPSTFSKGLSVMNLQEWDNTISIVANTITALSVTGGVIFGGSKLKDFINTKNKEIAFQSAVALYDEIIAYRGKLGQIRIRLNYALEIMNESHRTNTLITSAKYLELQELGIGLFETSLTIGNLFIKTHNFNGLFNDKSLKKVTNIVDISHKITNHLNNFFDTLITATKEKIISDNEIRQLYFHSDKFDEFSTYYLKACTDIQRTKFNDFCNIK